MTRNELRKRLKRVEASPLKPYVAPRTELRRESNKISNIPEDDIQFDDFFEFEEDLSELEAARKQFERIEEERIAQENRMRALGILPEEENSFTLDMEEDGQIEMKPLPSQPFYAVPVVSDSEKKPEVKICKFVKDDDERCKRAASRGEEYCHHHKKKSLQG